ncbi:Zinc finger protein 410 [Phytophthora citrophthora]|uniref:Zinc finger protein 410 n=1 Tax=Phytophthora citrophthora TaxID=4793 RepID=A0AAD9LFY0_9STRA|nr:Zinc finger protein 410 [Phytophthora citrophthora]
MQAMLSDNSRDPPFYLQRSTSLQHPPPQYQDPNTHANLQGGAIANLASSANVNVNANANVPAPPRRTGTSRRAAPSEDRPFACPVPNCGGRFHRKFTLHEHLKTHTGEQPHQCPVAECGKRFSTSGNLARHRKLHAMRKISCPAAHCTRVFTSREKLVPHLKVHLARTPHTCDFAGCGKTFSTAGNLTRHRRTQHRAGPSTRQEIPAPVPTGPVPTLPRPRFEFPGRAPPPTGSLPMRGLLWPNHVEQQHPSQQHPPQQHPPQQQRILESDVQDLFDCLFVENAQAAAAAQANGHHNVAIIRDRLPKLEPPRESRVPQQQTQAPPYLTATYEF